MGDVRKAFPELLVVDEDNCGCVVGGGALCNCGCALRNCGGCLCGCGGRRSWASRNCGGRLEVSAKPMHEARPNGARRVKPRGPPRPPTVLGVYVVLGGHILRSYQTTELVS